MPRAASGPRFQPPFIPQVGKASQYLILGGSRRSIHDIHYVARLGVNLFILRSGHHVKCKRLAQPGILFCRLPPPTKPPDALPPPTKPPDANRRFCDSWLDSLSRL